MPIKRAVLSLLLFLSISGSAFAEVDREKGAFLVSYSDIAYSGGLELRIFRTYNSKSQFKSIFGLGWGSEYETYLTVTGYGPVVVHEDGNRIANRFFPENWTPLDTRKIADLVVEAATKNGDVKSPEEADSLRQKLLLDPEFVDQEWRKYADRKLLAFQDLTPGVKVRSSWFGYEEIFRVSDGYVRTSNPGRRVEKFNEKGGLVRREDANGNFIQFVFDANGNHSMITDNFDRKLVFTYNARHLVEKIVGNVPKGRERVASYKYDDKDQMIYSQDDEGIAYDHEYVSPHKMSKIRYPDKTTKEMTYIVESNPKLATVKEPDGTVISYHYSLAAGDPNRSIVDEVQSKSRKPTIRGKYEYFYAHKSSGERWVRKKIETVAGAVTETEYDENCRCPLIIKTSKGVARFKYDPKGRVLRKDTPTETIEREFDENVGRVSSVRRYPTGKPAKAVWAKFAYDAKGNMTLAERSNGKHVKLSYDSYGRVQELVSSSNKRIRFVYNNDSRPTEVQVSNVGTLRIQYNEAGEIKETSSEPASQRGEAALQVISLFDELTAITKLSEVSFSM